MDKDQRLAGLEKRLRDLEAREGIRDTIARYSYAVDREDWTEIDAIFADDAVVDRKWREEHYRGKQAVLGFFQRHRGQVKFSNRMSNLNERIKVDGDRATATTYALVMYTYNQQSYIGWGAYDWEFRFEKDMWRITREGITIAVMTTLSRGWGMETDRVLTLPHLQEKKG